MNRPAQLCRASVLLFACLSIAPCILAQTPEIELRAAEEQLATALIEDDTAAFERLLAEGFVLRGAPDVDRATWMKNAVDLCWGERFEIADLSVTSLTTDTAVVSLVMTTMADPVTCEPAVVRSLLTDVWVRRPGGWRLSLRHSGPAGDSVSAQFAQSDPPPPLWERAAELSLVATGGNTDTRTLGVGGSVTWRPGDWVTRARTTYVRSATAGMDTAESLTADLRQSRNLTPRLDVRAGAVYLVDRFAGIDRRITVDGGLGWVAIDAKPHSLKLDAGAGVTNELRLDGTELTFPVGTIDGLYRWQLSRTSELTEQAVYSADLSDAGNWRLRNVVNVTVALSRLLSFKVSHELRRNNRPVVGFGTTDTVLSVALVAKF